MLREQFSRLESFDTGLLPARSQADDRPVSQPLGRIILQPVLYPNIYIWYVFFASMDIMLTWVILHLRGSELNPIARWIIHEYDLAGMVLYKFLLVFFVVGICEFVGRIQHKALLSRDLAKVSVAITALPVFVAVFLLISKIFTDGAVWDWETVSDERPYYMMSTNTTAAVIPHLPQTGVGE